MRTLRLIGTFYKSYVIASSIITISCMRLIYMYGIDIFTVLFWFKIVTLGIIVYYINNYKKNEFYYYQSLGLSKLFLWISTIIIDLSLFIILLITMLQIR
ncbi:MAG: hypothetical protein IMY72_07050 [Bacteroidetes bacterium]|nr:hypothetical protein [Bacteroidota bacterium]